MTPRHHELKCDEQYFASVWDGSKTFEYRINDRGFQRGDTVCLKETRRHGSWYCDRYVTATIGYVYPVPSSSGVGYVVFSLLNIGKVKE